MTPGAKPRKTHCFDAVAAAAGRQPEAFAHSAAARRPTSQGLASVLRAGA